MVSPLRNSALGMGVVIRTTIGGPLSRKGVETAVLSLNPSLTLTRILALGVALSREVSRRAWPRSGPMNTGRQVLPPLGEKSTLAVRASPLALFVRHRTSVTGASASRSAQEASVPT